MQNFCTYNTDLQFTLASCLDTDFIPLYINQFGLIKNRGNEAKASGHAPAKSRAKITAYHWQGFGSRLLELW